jgi:HAD superfamily hydrolase (TIGR01509 family)
MVKAILWDNDGIQVDTEHLYYLATKQVFEKLGLSLSEENYIELFLIKSKGAWHLLEEKGFTSEEVQGFRNERNSIYSSFLSKGIAPIAGIKEVLNELHGKYKMGVVTSSKKVHFQIIHSTTGLLNYFDFVIASGDYKKSKPDPEPYQLAVKRTGFTVEECIAVEDSQRGLASALAAGIKCIVVPNGLTKSCDFTGAYRQLNEIREIIPLLK